MGVFVGREVGGGNAPFLAIITYTEYPQYLNAQTNSRIILVFSP